MAADRVLVVEDEQGESVKENLEARGFKVRLARDGRQAVEMAESWVPDVVLLDINLPVLNGFEVLEELKRRKVATRVVMCSAYQVGSETAVKCMRAGACDYFEKALLSPAEEADRLRRYTLLESTLIDRVSEPAPIVERLLDKTKLLERELAEAEKKQRSVARREVGRDAFSKSVYICLALFATYLLRQVVPSAAPTLVGLFFLILVALLFLPTDRLQDISAKAMKFAARVKLK